RARRACDAGEGKEAARSRSLVEVSRCASGAGAEILGPDLGWGRAGRTARAVLEWIGICGGAGVRHDRDHRNDYAEPSLPRCQRNDWKATAGPRGEAGSRRRSAGARGDDLGRELDDWLATGDLAEKTATGELKFLGRKSEVIVTASGVNIHPEDLEEAIEQEPGVKGCAVVPVETANGPEPYAVLAVRGSEEQALAAVEHANERLAEFQRVLRWSVWPEPDLPRTSTGKVRRNVVAAWGGRAKTDAYGKTGSNGVHRKSSGDLLLELIAATTG